MHEDNLDPLDFTLETISVALTYFSASRIFIFFFSESWFLKLIFEALHNDEFLRVLHFHTSFCGLDHFEDNPKV